MKICYPSRSFMVFNPFGLETKKPMITSHGLFAFLVLQNHPKVLLLTTLGRPKSVHYLRCKYCIFCIRLNDYTLIFWEVDIARKACISTHSVFGVYLTTTTLLISKFS